LLATFVVAIKAFPQNSANNANCGFRVRLQCRSVFGTGTPTRSKCNECDQCDQCGALGLLKLIAGNSKFAKEAERKCNRFCKGGKNRCKSNCLTNIDKCKACTI